MDMVVSGHNNSCWGTNVSGHNHVWAQTCLDTVMYGLNHVDTIMSGHKCAWEQTCLGTIMSGHKHVWTQLCMGLIMWTQSCLGTNVPGNKRVWAQSCLGMIVSGHKRVWAQLCGPIRVGPIVYDTNVVEPAKTKVNGFMRRITVSKFD